MDLINPSPLLGGLLQEFGDQIMRKKILEAVEAVRPFVPVMQLKCLVDGLRGEERAFFREKLLALVQTLATMPVTYAQDGLGDEAVVHLHYFFGGCDWWITEKDVEGGIDQAFGLVDLGHGPELGYISIRELVRMRGMDLDLHWTPKTLKALKAEKNPPSKPAPEPPRYSMEMLQELSSLLAVAPANGVWH
jgi:hypothetical protein